MDSKDHVSSTPTFIKRKMRLTCDERIERLERKIQILSNEVQAYKERLKNDSDEELEEVDDIDDDNQDDKDDDDEDNNDKEDEHEANDTKETKNAKLNTGRLDCARANVVDRSLYQQNIFKR